MERVWLLMGTLSWDSIWVLSWEIVIFGFEIVTLSNPSLLRILIIILFNQVGLYCITSVFVYVYSCIYRDRYIWIVEEWRGGIKC